MPVGLRTTRAPLPPWPWRRSSVPVGRRSAASPPSPSGQHCGGEQRPGPCGRSAARDDTTNAAAALCVAGTPPASGRQLGSAMHTGYQQKRATRNLSEPGGGGGGGGGGAGLV